MLVLNVTFKCKPGMREEFLEKIIEEGIDVGSRNEEYNFKYDFYLPVGEDAKDDLFLLEWWKDTEAHLAHREEPHYARLGELKEIYVLDTVVDRLREE